MNRVTIVSGVKLVAFIVVTSLATLVLATTIGSVSTAGGTSYSANFADITGLQVGDDIRVAGVDVGQVTGMRIVDHNIARVAFSVDRSVHLRQSVNVKVRFRNLIGQRYLAMDQGSPADPALPAGSVIPISQTAKALDLTVLLNGFKPLFKALTPADVNRLSFEIIQTLQGEGGTFNSLLAHTASLTTTIANKDQVIGQVVTNFNKVLATITDRDSQLTKLIIQLQHLVTGLAQDKNAIRDSLQGIDDLATATVGFLQPVRAPLKADIAKLGTLAGQLDDTKDILNKELGIIPRKLNTVLRTASYGGWFNFYLCKGDGTVIDAMGHPIPVNGLVNTSGTACNTS